MMLQNTKVQLAEEHFLLVIPTRNQASLNGNDYMKLGFGQIKLWILDVE
jgi:hypothetical protein